MRKALIVDDSAWIHSLVRAQLGKEFELSSAFDGASGLARANELNPEFILLDVDLPDLQGYEVCRRLKASDATKAVPVIFLTSMKQIDERIRGLNCGACEYITKPVAPLELRARVRAIVREKHAIETCMQATLIDPTTGLFNQHYLETRLEGELARARRSGQSLACLMVGIDGMDPDIHDPFDPAMDKMMHTIGLAIREACRKEDVVCCSSKEVIAILAVSMNRTAAQILAERVQEYIKVCKATMLGHSKAFSVSV
jgi:diguanylate cyclase (GGDEF)-like protein